MDFEIPIYSFEIVAQPAPARDNHADNEKSRLMTREDVAQRFSTSTETVDRWVKKKQLTYSKIGRLVRFESVDVERFQTHYRVLARV